MARSVDLIRHPDNDGDRLSDQGIEAAVLLADRLEPGYKILVSSGAQRATETLAYFIVTWEGFGGRLVVDPRFRSEAEDRWFEAYKKAGAGDLNSFLRVDGEFVEQEAQRFAGALKDLFDLLGEGGRGLVVGHSPMHEAAVYGMTGKIIPPLGKGEGIRLSQDGDSTLIGSLGQAGA